MAKEYKRGEKYYLPVTISSIAPGYQYPIELMFADCDERDTTDTVRIADEPDLLLTADEIATDINTERAEVMENLGNHNLELSKQNAELEALLKEVMETRDEAIKQNDELITENKKLKAENGAWQIAAQTCADNAKVADKATEELRKENKDLKAKAAENADTISRLSANKVALTEEVGRLRETIADRTIDVQHIAEENAQLQNKVSEFQNRVGEQLAQIQDLNAEIHFLKAPKEAKKPVHVFTNDGTEVEFRRYTSVQYRTDYNILVIKDGEEIVAGFIRGDRPGNLAYWWTE